MNPVGGCSGYLVRELNIVNKLWKFVVQLISSMNYEQ
jgi:hypothetical protein